MADIFDVVDYIEDSIGFASDMKLQKLCYYAQAWSLAWNDKPLFEEDFYAWKSGPVCHDLFHNSTRTGNSDELSEEQKCDVDLVLKHYGKEDELWLGQLSCSEIPWIQAREQDENGAALITKESMKAYYKAISKETSRGDIPIKPRFEIGRDTYRLLLERIADLEDAVDKLTTKYSGLEYRLTQSEKARRWMV